MGAISKIPHNKPWINGKDRAAVDAVLKLGWIAQGEVVRSLEAAFVELHDGGEACAVSSGTAALALALYGLGVQSGMRVAVPTYACSALLNAVHWAGAKPMPVDISRDTLNLDPGRLEGTVDAMILVHTFGEPAPVDICRQRAGVLIEDCCHSLGGAVDGISVGRSGDAAIHSFYATKVISGGQGGMVWLRSKEAFDRIHDYRQFDCRPDYKPRFNFQLTDIQAALVLSQFGRLDQVQSRRAAVAKLYARALPAGFGVQKGILNSGRMAYRFVVLAPDQQVREALRRHLERRRISSIIPVERYELLHRYLGLGPEMYPEAERIVDISLSLPIYPSMSEADAERVCNALEEFHP